MRTTFKWSIFIHILSTKSRLFQGMGGVDKCLIPGGRKCRARGLICLGICLGFKENLALNQTPLSSKGLYQFWVPPALTSFGWCQESGNPKMGWPRSIPWWFSFEPYPFKFPLQSRKSNSQVFNGKWQEADPVRNANGPTAQSQWYQGYHPAANGIENPGFRGQTVGAKGLAPILLKKASPKHDSWRETYGFFNPTSKDLMGTQNAGCIQSDMLTLSLPHHLGTNPGYVSKQDDP